MTGPYGESGAAGREVEAIVRRIRRKLLGRAAGAGAAWSLALVALVLATAWLWAGPGGWIRGSRVPLLLDGALAAAVAAASVVLWREARRRFSEAGVARSLDREAGLPDGTTHGSVELGRRLPPGVSAALARSAGDRVLGHLPREARRSGGSVGEAPARWLLGGVCTLLVAGGLAVFLGLRDPMRARTAWAGLAAPTAILSVPEMAPLRISPRSGELPRGTELRVRVEAPGRDRVELRWQFAGDVARTREERVDGERARFLLGPLTAPVELRARAPDGARTEVVRIVPEDPLLITDLSLQVRYPPHTGRGTERYQREPPPLALPVGTRIGIEGRASRPLGEAALRPVEAQTEERAVELAVSGDRFSAEWRPRRGGSYAWVLRDTGGRVPEGTPPPLEISLVPDSAPSVDFLVPGRDTLLSLDRRQPLVIRARDDHGLATLELIAYRVSAFGERGAPVTRSLETGGTRAALARPVLDVSGWDLLPGDTVRYRARVVDNAPAPRTAETPEFALRVARSGELADEVGERLREAVRAVDSLREVAGRAAEESRDLERRRAERSGEPGTRRSRSPAGRPGSRAQSEAPSYQARAEVEQAMERQAGLMEGTDSLREEMTELARSARDAGLADPELERDLQELRSLLEEVSRTGDRREIERMRDRLEGMDSRELSDALRSVSEDQEALREQLDEALERFRRAAAEQDFRATAQQARELAREEEALAEAMEEGGERGEVRAAQQEELRRRASELEEGMEALEERLTRLGENDARSGVEEARNASRDAEAAMSRSSRASRQGRPRDARESAREAAGSLRESADRMDQARSEMAQRMEEAVGEALRRTTTEALALARRQAELGEEIRGADAEEEARIRGDQAALLEGLRNLSGQAAGLSTMAPGVGRSLSEAVGEAEEAVSRTLEAMERDGPARRDSPSAVAEEAVGALNRLAMAAASGGENAQGQGQSASAGGQQLMEQLQQLARRQGSLMEQSGAVSAMELGQESLQGQLEEMARGQDGIAGELGELARRQEEIPDDRVLGDLRSMGEEARDLADLLAGGRLNAQTRRRQERLFHRLLDAGRSLEKDEEARERESRTAGPVERVRVEPLTEDALGGSRYGLPDAALLQSLPPAQRALVIRYFERLNRESEVPPEGGEGRR